MYFVSMANKINVTKERHLLSKLIGMRLARAWVRSHVSSEGATKVAKEFVDKLTPVEVLEQLAKLKRKQSIKSCRRQAMLHSEAQLREATKLQNKGSFVKKANRLKK